MMNHDHTEFYNIDINNNLMLLADKKIKEYIKSKKILVDPFDENLIGPASLDLRLGFKFRVFKNIDVDAIDPKEYRDEVIFRTETDKYIIHHGKYSDLYILKDPETPFIIHPGEFVLASIYEYIKLPDNIAAQIQGRSSYARLGLIIHTSAGWVDPGYSGHLTLEIVNVNKIPIKLYSMMHIAQILFFELDSVETPYYARKSSKYVDEGGATESKIYKDFEK